MVELKKGDCLKLLGDIPAGTIDAVVTDPPFRYLSQRLDRDFNADYFYAECKRVLKDDGFIVIFGRGGSFYSDCCILDKLGFLFKEEIIWDKCYTSTIMLPISRHHETIAIFSKNKKQLYPSLVPYAEKRITNPERIEANLKTIVSVLGNSEKLEAVKKVIRTGKVEITNKDCKVGHVLQKKKKETNSYEEATKAIFHGMKESSIIQIKRDAKTKHPTQKPVRLMERLIALVSQEGDTILDPFMGGGSTGIASVNTGRNFIGIEIDDEYFNLAQERIKEETRQPFLDF